MSNQGPTRMLVTREAFERFDRLRQDLSLDRDETLSNSELLHELIDCYEQ